MKALLKCARGEFNSMLKKGLLITLLVSICVASSKWSLFPGKWKGSTKLPSIILNLNDAQGVLRGTVVWFSPAGQQSEYQVINPKLSENTLAFQINDSNGAMNHSNGELIDFWLTVDNTGQRGVLKIRGKEMEMTLRMVKIPRSGT
jgi:hypothetical protein